MRTETTMLPYDEDDFYDTSAYAAPDFKGIFTGELTYTKWGRHHNKIAFIDLVDGRKIVVHAWSGNFFGLREMAYGTRIEVTLKRNGKGCIYLADLKNIEEYMDMEEYLDSKPIPIL